MKKIIIWGTKEKGVRVFQSLNTEENIVIAFTDIMQKSSWTMCDNIDVLPSYQALTLDYDYIIIASVAYSEITVYLEMMGVRDEKIVQAFNASFMIPDTLYFFDKIDENQDNKLKLFKSLDSLILGAF